MLRLTRSSCLVRATVRQTWWAAHGRHRDVVIGVRPPSAGFAAHAWLEGDADNADGRYDEISRKPSPAV